MSNGRGARLPGADDPLGQASDYLAVAQAGSSPTDGRNDSIFLAAALSVADVRQHLQHLVSLYIWSSTADTLMNQYRPTDLVVLSM